MQKAPVEFQADIEAINSISIVPTLLNVLCSTTGMRFAAIARVTESRWVSCSVLDKISFGLKPGEELEIETTFCNVVRKSNKPVVINHVDKDEQYNSHPIPAMYGFQSYISVPIIRKDGSFFGTLCSIDPNPAIVNTPEVIGMFNLYAELIAFHLSTIDQLENTELQLKEEREIAELREQFIAILGHDLRNPVATTKASTELLLEMTDDSGLKRIIEVIQATNFRMEGLIDNMLDFARGRMGGGITLNPALHQESLEDALKQVISEMQAMSGRQVFETHIAIKQAVQCDAPRIAQLFSNLLGNAITHGAANSPVKVDAFTEHDEFVLRVSNKGDKIPEAAMKKLFHPFSRAEVKPGKKGLGLGLYIASEIARAHQGELKVSSTDEETSFSFHMPVNA
ncbi:GAF domain-containing sensor histidine kinase [Catalinimonas sp. 4WD22]|uniref:GAF domain-containing sensor histidine kinase n=1 Tax=Catalinimonas locisalis TaxID=3133978 RepID=UPI0031014633